MLRCIRPLMARNATFSAFGWWTLVCTLLCWLILSLLWGAYSLQAHGGGAPRLTGEMAGPYRIFAWTQPEPLRVGDIHLSIGVVQAASGNDPSGATLDKPVTDATVTVSLRSPTSDTEPLTILAVPQVQLGSYYYEADATLPTPGDWRFTIEVNSHLGSGSTTFVGTVVGPREFNWLLIGVAAVLLLCLLGLIGLWNRLQARESVL